MEKSTRRKFIWLANTGIVALFILLWNKLTLTLISVKEQKPTSLPLNKNQLVSFQDNYIVINQGGKISVFSSHCTHLGCKISTYKNEKLICPCHGSEYNLEGRPLKGPAYKNLELIPSTVSESGTEIAIG